MKKRLFIILLMQMILLISFSSITYGACTCPGGTPGVTTSVSQSGSLAHTVNTFCTGCGQRIYSTEVAHSLSGWTTVSYPSCTGEGREISVCSECGYTASRSSSALGHEWGGWYVETPATCVQDGVQKRVCGRDSGHVETATIGKSGHKDDSPYDGYCDYDNAHDLNTAPTLTLGSFNGKYYNEGDEIILTVSSATKGTNAAETWDTVSFSATLAGASGSVTATNAGTGTSSASATIKWNINNISSDGKYKATVVVRDSRGVTATKESTEIIIDRTNPAKPTINAITDWTKENVTATITAGNADISGLDKVTYVLSGATTKSETEISNGGKITIENQGETTITAYTYDNAGNKSEAESKVIRIERIVPTVEYEPDGSNGEYAQEFTTIVTVDDFGEYISGLNESSLKYLWTTSTTKPSESAFSNGTSFSSGDEITTPKNVSDNHYLWILAKDNAGNVAIVRSENFLVDNLKPLVEFDKNSNTTYEKEHIVKVTVEDSRGNINCGIEESSLRYLWTESKTAPTEDDFYNEGTAFASEDEIATPSGETGEYYLWVIAKDKVGNTEIISSGVQRIDNDPPSVEYTFLNDDTVIYTSFDVVIKDLFEDIVRSGVDDDELKYEISLRPVSELTYPESYINNRVNDFPADLEGQYYFYIIAKDKAGNVTEKSEIIAIDTKLPVITFTPNGNEEFANSQSTVVTISDYSMITSAKYVWTTSKTTTPVDDKFEENFVTGDTITTPDGLTGDYYLWVMVEDKAGNVIKTVSNVFKLDNTLPQIEFKPNGSSDYKNSHEVKVTVSEGSNECGVNLDSLKYVWTTSSTAPSKDEITESFTNGEELSTPDDVEGIYYLWIYAEDNIGNEIIKGSNLFNLDDKNVVVTFEPIENKAYAPEHSTKVTFSDLGSKVKESSLKYFWTTDETIEDPEESLFTNSFVNGALIETPKDGNGIYYLWVMGEDYTGNKIKAKSGEFWLDNTELLIDLTIIENVGITGRGIHIEVDDSQKPIKEDSIKYLISYSAEKPLVSDYENAASNNSDVIFEEGLERQAYVWVMVEDENGVVHMSYIYMIIDTKAPEVVFNPNGNSEDMSVVETEVTLTDYSIIEDTKYLWSEDPELNPSGEDFTEEFENGDTIYAPIEDGDYYLYIYTKDLVGNDVVVRSEVFKVDHTPPTMPIIEGQKIIDGVPSGDNIESGKKVNKDVLIKVTDGIDERDEGVITTITITKDGTPIDITPDENGNYTLTEEGEYVITAVTEDMAGNKSDVTTYKVIIDKTPPVAPVVKGEEMSGDKNEVPHEGATKEDVKVTFEASDPEDEIIIKVTKDGEEVDLESGDYTLTEDGTYVFTVKTKDEAENESEEVIYEVTIDKTAPAAPIITGVEITGEQKELNSGDTTKEQVEITIEAEEELVLVVTKDGTPIDITLDENGKCTLDENGTYVFTAKTKDSVGNESEEIIYEIKIYKIDAPTIEVKEDTDEEKIIPDGGLTNNDVIITTSPVEPEQETKITVKKDGEDVTETLEKDPDGNYILEEEGTYEIIAKVEDGEGNSSEETIQTIIIDKTAPVPEIIGTSVEANVELPNETITKDTVKIEILPGEDNREDAVVITEVTISKDGEDVTDTLRKDEEGNYILEEDGEYEVTVVSKDDAGNESEEVKYKITIDENAPKAPVISLIPSDEIIPGEEPNPEVSIPNGGSSNDELLVYPEENDEGETTTIVITDEEGNDRTEEFTNPETEEIIIDKSGVYDITATTVKDNNPDKKTITVTHVKVDIDAPIANDDEKATEQSTPVDGKIEATDNFEVTGFEIAINPENGTLTINPETGEYTYTPEEGFYGEDTFKIVAKDEVGNESEGGFVTVTVRKTLEESDVVEEKDKSIETYKDKAYISNELPQTDKNGDTLNYTISENATNGTVTFDEATRKFTYTPNKDYTGNDSFKLEVTNGKETIVITFNVLVKRKVIPSGGGSSSDKDDTSSEEVEETITHEWYIRGYSDGTVRPDGKITREEIAMMFYRLAIGSANTLKSKNVIKYSDVSSDRWSYEAIMYLTEVGILKGYEDGTFKPQNAISRAELAMILVRYNNMTSKTAIELTDIKGHWAEDAIEKVVTKGWMIGYDDGTFKPSNKLSRAEVAVVINRILGRNVENAKVNDNPFNDLKRSHWAYNDMIEAITTHTCVITDNDKEEWKSHEYPYLSK